jgi:hypothetical protein
MGAAFRQPSVSRALASRKTHRPIVIDIGQASSMSGNRLARAFVRIRQDLTGGGLPDPAAHTMAIVAM